MNISDTCFISINTNTIYSQTIININIIRKAFKLPTDISPVSFVITADNKQFVVQSIKPLDSLIVVL